MAGRKLFFREPVDMDLASLHRLTRVAGRISTQGSLSWKLLRNRLSISRVSDSPQVTKTENTSFMNTNPVRVPPTISATNPLYPAPQRLGENPEERQPIPNLVVAVEAILRQPRRVMYQLRQPGSGKLMVAMLFVTILCILLYGLVVGSFSMGDQLWAAPIKLALGMLISALICLP